LGILEVVKSQTIHEVVKPVLPSRYTSLVYKV